MWKGEEWWKINFNLSLPVFRGTFQSCLRNASNLGPKPHSFSMAEFKIASDLESKIPTILELLGSLGLWGPCCCSFVFPGIPLLNLVCLPVVKTDKARLCVLALGIICCFLVPRCELRGVSLRQEGPRVFLLIL